MKQYINLFSFFNVACLKKTNFLVYLLYMISKKPFLFCIIAFASFLPSCAIPEAARRKINPPVKHFVKVVKHLTVKRCKKKEKTPKCETRHFYSSGSGLIISISKKKKIVLTAGHVCRTAGIKEEDKEYVYRWIETVKVLDSEKRVHDSHIILAAQHSPPQDTADLCSLYVPSLHYISKHSNLKISSRKPRVGEDIFYLGAPKGIYHPPTVLIIKGTYNGPIDNVAASATLRAGPGSSGSVILSHRNEIYGVLFAVHPSFDSASVITTYEKTKDFLEKTDKALRLD